MQEKAYKGKILKGVGGFYYVHLHQLNEIFECKAKGAFRNQKIKPAVGDDVEINIISENDHTGNIVTICNRENKLVRPAVANVDQAVILFALAEPKPNYNLLDRFLIMMEQQDVDTKICFNKADLVSEEEANKIKDIYQSAGYEVFLTAANPKVKHSESDIKADGTSGEELDRTDMVGIEEIHQAIQGKTTVFAGPSGVGKSSMLNALKPSAQVETGSISEKIKRGKHTTRHSELIYIEEDTFIMDTPGFSSLFVENIEPEDLKMYFREFIKYNGRCRFNGCIHMNEPECLVKDALAEGHISELRYENYKQLYEELKSQRRW